MAPRSVYELQTVLFPLVDGFNELVQEPFAPIASSRFLNW